MYDNRRMEALVGGLARLDRQSIDLLDLSLRRDLPDTEIAETRGIPAAEVGERRARALGRLMSELRIERFDEVVDMFTHLADLPAERWAQASAAAGSPVALHIGRPPRRLGRRASTVLVAFVSALAMALALPQGLAQLGLPSHRGGPAAVKPQPVQAGATATPARPAAHVRRHRPHGTTSGRAHAPVRARRAAPARTVERPPARGSARPRPLRGTRSRRPAAATPATPATSATPAPAATPPPVPTAGRTHPQRARKGRGAGAERKAVPETPVLPPGKAKRLPDLKVPLGPKI